MSLMICKVFQHVKLWCIFCCVVVDLASTYSSGKYFGIRFNQQTIAIFDVHEPYNTWKALVEFYNDMKIAGYRGMYLTYDNGRWLHKASLKGHLADYVARYATLSHRISFSLPFSVPLPHIIYTFVSVYDSISASAYVFALAFTLDFESTIVYTYMCLCV